MTLTSERNKEPNSIMSKMAFYLIVLLVFSIPWENMLMLPGIGTITRLVGFVGIVFGILAVIVDERGRSFGPFLSLVFAFLLYTFASFYWSVNQSETLKAINTLTQIFAFIWLIWEFVREERQVAIMLGAYVFGSFVSIWSTVNAYASGNGYIRYSASNFDPNDLGLILALGVPMAIFLGLRAKRRIISWFFYLYIPLASYAVLLTASRASFLALLCGLSYGVIIYKNISLIRKAAIIALILFALPVFITHIPVASIERLSTISEEVFSGTLNYRMVIWSSGIEAFSNNFVLGVGSGSFGPGVQSYLGSPRSPHNFFISVLVERGLIGIAITLGIIFFVFKNIMQSPYHGKYLGIFLMMTWMVGTLSVGWEVKKATWFLFTILVVMGHANKHREVETNEFRIS